MLSKVSWSQYIAVIVTLLSIYYFIVGLKLYKEEIKSLLSGKLLKKNKAANRTMQDNFLSDEALADASLNELEAIVNDLRYAILDKAGKEADKDHLLEQLQQRLANYTGLRVPAYRVAINNYIIINAKEICGVTFSAAELNFAWDAISN